MLSDCFLPYQRNWKSSNFSECIFLRNETGGTDYEVLNSQFWVISQFWTWPSLFRKFWAFFFFQEKKCFDISWKSMKFQSLFSGKINIKKKIKMSSAVFFFFFFSLSVKKVFTWIKFDVWHYNKLLTTTTLKRAFKVRLTVEHILDTIIRDY